MKMFEIWATSKDGAIGFIGPYESEQAARADVESKGYKVETIKDITQEYYETLRTFGRDA